MKNNIQFKAIAILLMIAYGVFVLCQTFVGITFSAFGNDVYLSNNVRLEIVEKIRYLSLIIWGILIFFVTILSFYFTKYILKGLTPFEFTENSDELKYSKTDLEKILLNFSKTIGLEVVPNLRIIKSDVPNAFAQGLDIKNSEITITSGLIELLDLNEIECILAHELNHIKNRDTQFLTFIISFLSLTLACAILLTVAAGLLIALAVILGAIAAIISLIVMIGMAILGLASLGKTEEKDKTPLAIFAIILFALWQFVQSLNKAIEQIVHIFSFTAAALLAFVFALVVLIGLRFAFSREREFLADIGAVELTDARTYIRCLSKLAEEEQLIYRPAQLVLASPMLFIGSLSDILLQSNKYLPSFLIKLIDTHPPVRERIRRIEMLQFSNNRIFTI